MRVAIAQLYEDGGRPLARHRAVTLQPSHVGRFSLTEEHDRDFRRSVRSARLRNEATGEDVIPRLRDAVVVWVGDSAWTVTGFETDPVTRRCVAQSWYVVPQSFSAADA